MHDFYVKPHPNAVPESGPIYESLFKKYPKIKKIDPSISNLAISKSGFTCAFTVYGTVAHEFSYLGLPTISAGENPHSAFSFTRVPRSIEELREWVSKLEPWTPDRNEVLKFIFMHNYPIINKFTQPKSDMKSLKTFDISFSELEQKMKADFERIQLNEDLI
jgi:hypothetical protein